MALIGPMKYLTIGGSTYEILGLEITSSAITSALGYTPYNGSTNPNGYISSYTDEKLKTTAVTSGTTYYPIVGSNSTTAANKNYDSTGFSYAGTNGTANGTNGNALLTLGNNTASTSANWKKGTVRLYGTTAYYTDLVSGTPSANRTITFPNATGTVALTSDIPTVPTNVSAFINDAGYITSDSDEKLKTNAVSNTSIYYPILGSNSSTASTKYYSTNFKVQDVSSGIYLTLGSTTNSKSGILQIVKGEYVTSLSSTTLTASRDIYLPDKGGTIALTSDISDVNVTSTAVTAATTNYITGSTTSTTTTGTLSKHASAVMYTTADSGTSGYTQLRLGNTTATSSAGGKEGQIRLYGTNATYYVNIKGGAQTANHNLTLPNADGTVALTSDIPSITLNGSSTTSPSFYAPTSAGTSGYYLKSNGSGAPSWTSFPTIPSAGSLATAIGTTASGGSASTWSKSDHVHNITSATITSALGYTPYNGTTNPNGYVTTAGTQVQIVRW